MIKQTQLFDLLKAHFKTSTECYEAVSEVLCISPDAVKKIASGSTALSYERFVKLVKHFKIPLEHIQLQGNMVHSRYISLRGDFVGNYLLYVANLAERLELLAGAESASISFAADEIPVFHFMRYPELTYLRLYFHSYEDFRHKCSFEEFVAYMDGFRLRDTFARIVSAYDRIPSTEIWNRTVADPIRRQILLISEIGAFEGKRTKTSISEQLIELVKQVESCCTVSSKPGGGRFDFFMTPFNVSPGMMLTECGGEVQLSLKLGPINSISLSDPLLIEEMKVNFKKSIDESIWFGVGATLSRVSYFKHLYTRLTALRDKLSEKAAQS